MPKKRTYHSEVRTEQAELTKTRILAAAKQRFAADGYDKTTIDSIATLANVSVPTIYATFKSKEGILLALMQTVLFGEQYQTLVENAHRITDPVEALAVAANITRTIYDADQAEIALIRGASVLSPVLKELELQGERQRYARQAFIIRQLADAGLLPDGMDIAPARDILWSLTSRELYHKFIVERGWSSEAYEMWLRRTLRQTLVRA